MIVDVPEVSKAFIGNDVPSKILFGTMTWFFHLVSDVAGSSSSVGKSGGTGIPGPILALAKELSVLPVFKNMNVGENLLSVFLSKLFNGTLLAKHDENGKIIKETVLKFDLRGELGVGIELGRQAVPVVANDCIVRTFYFIRRLAVEIRSNDIRSISDMNQINWDNVKTLNNPAIASMLTISTGVFTTIDVGEAVITQKYWVSINYVGVGRFAIAIGEDVSWCLKARNVKQIKQVYEDIKRFAYMQEDDNIYKRIGVDMDVDIDKLGLTVEQTEFLYNLEYYKTLNDIETTKQPHKTWFRLVLLEAMLFELYYTLGLDQDKKGNSIPCKKYHPLQIPTCGYSKNSGDAYLDSYFNGDYYHKGYIKRLRKCYEKVAFEIKEVLKGLLIGGAITAGIAIVTIATAGALAGPIAVALVGSNFAGLRRGWSGRSCWSNRQTEYNIAVGKIACLRSRDIPE